MSTEMMQRDSPRIGTEVPRLSPTIAKILLSRSPMHAWDAHRLGGNHKAESSDAMTNGLILERLLLECGPEVAEIDAPDWRTKAAKEARDAAEADGKIAVLAHKMERHYRTVAAWKGQLDEAGIWLAGESQVTLTWEEAGVPCKGVLDHLIVDEHDAVIYDLKTCADASKEAVARSMVGLGHDLQYAAYIEGVEATYPHLAGRVRMLFLYCEAERPYAVNVVEPAGTMKALGRRKWRAAVRTWGECLRTGRFPGYADAITRVDAKPWQLDEAMTEGGFDGDGDSQ